MLAFDAASNGNAVASSLTFSHTCSGANLILFVGFQITDGTDNVTGVTYNSVSMTQVTKINGSTSPEVYLYYLIAPATGANNVVISLSGSKTVVATSASYSGALQTGQPDSFNSATVASAASLTIATTVVKSGCWLVSQKASPNQNSLASGTVRATDVSGTAIGDSNGVVGTGSQSLTWNENAGTHLTGIVASIAPIPTNAGLLLNFL